MDSYLSCHSVGFDILTNDFDKYINDISVFNLKTLNVFKTMKHVTHPMEVTWYYVEACACYFPYVEHRINGILLDGLCKGLPPFVVPFSGCRIASYEEVYHFYNREAEEDSLHVEHS